MVDIYEGGIDMIKKYIKKPVQIEAIQLKEDILNCYWEKWQKNMKRIGKEWN